MLNPTKDFEEIREGLLSIDPDVSHRATQPPAPAEIYTPRQHIAALDPDNALVVGIRGAGKSFWAAALGDQAARTVAVSAYPRLGLDTYEVVYGFTGFEGGDCPSPETVQQYANSSAEARLFWRIVVLRVVLRAAELKVSNSYRELVQQFADSEEREAKMRLADEKLRKKGGRLLIIFDALDTLSNDWTQLRTSTKALLEVTYAMRSYHYFRLKLFIRPEQLEDPALGFTDLSKLKAGKIDLSWTELDLYGLFFSRLANADASRNSFIRIARSEHIDIAVNGELVRLPTSLMRDAALQERVFTRFAGPYMGSDHRKGKTYTWLPAHLADGFKTVTPRSFLTALRRAAEKSEAAQNRVFTVDGIKDGLRAASRVRVEQLKDEYKWIELALEPLAGLRVPCPESDIISRWLQQKTTTQILQDSTKVDYLPPSEMPAQVGVSQERAEIGLLRTLIKIGVLERRPDGRMNMPDIFRIGASLIGRGRVAPAA
jgi:hypothetical protein